MKKLLFLLLAVVAFIPSYPQKAPPKFGEITMDDLVLQRYPLDTTAGAVILFDRGESSLNSQLQVAFRRHVRIKFFSKDDINTWASRTIFIDRLEESLSKLKAVTYNNENGKIVESVMDEKSIFKTKYDRWTNEVKFTFPNVKEGSVVEYSYTIHTSASLLPGWQFQQKIPVVWSEYVTDIPSNMTFKRETTGHVVFDEHKVEHNGSVETFIMKNVPAIKEEPYTRNIDDHISRIDFNLSEVIIFGEGVKKFDKSWWSIVKGLDNRDDFGVQIRASGFLREKVQEVTAGLDDEKKIEAIYNYVKTNVSWDKFIDAIPDRPFKKVLEEKKGSSSEINLMLVSMLQKAGLKAYPVLLSTRDHGTIKQFYPRFNQFNYVICLVKLGDKKILLDGTDKNLPMRALPKRCLNGRGLVASKDEMEWIPLSSIRSKETITLDGKIGETGEITANLSIVTDGVEAGEVRSAYSEKSQDEYVKEFLVGKNWEVTNTTFENMDDPSKSVKQNYAIDVRDHAQSAGSVMYLNPFVLSQMTENIFKSEERLYPVDFSTPFEEFYIAKLQLPDGYQVEELPKQKMLLLPNNAGKFVINATLTGSTINYVSQIMINKSVFSTNEYSALREFYGQIVAKQAEQIVLKKK